MKQRLEIAQAQSELARARVQGMKIRAQLDPPRAAQSGFPYPARTCAQWTEEDEFDGRTKPRKKKRRVTSFRLPREMSDKRRLVDATEGSAALLDALRRAAA